MTNNYGLYLIPIVSTALFASRIHKCTKYHDGNVYHIYIDGYHEQWSKTQKVADVLIVIYLMINIIN